MDTFQHFLKDWCWGSRAAFISLLNIDTSKEADELIEGNAKLTDDNCNRKRFIKYLESNIITQDREDALIEAIKELERRLITVNKISSYGFILDRKDKK